MNFKAPLFCIVFLSHFVFSNANCSGEIAIREDSPAETKSVTGLSRERREYSDTVGNEYEYGDEYEADNGIDYYETDTDGDSLYENTYEDYGDLDEMNEEVIDYDGEDYYGYDEGEGEYEDSDEDSSDYEYNASDWEDNDSSSRELEYDEYESDEGQTAEDLELWYRKRRATEDEALICNTDKEREVVRRISSLKETITVMEQQLNYEQNKCQSKSIQSVTNPTTITTTDKPHPKQHHKQNKKVDGLPVCEI